MSWTPQENPSQGSRPRTEEIGLATDSAAVDVLLYDERRRNHYSAAARGCPKDSSSQS